MKHIWKYLSLICYELFAAFLVWALIKGTAGLVAALIFIVIVSVLMFVGRIENSDVKCPLLLDLLIISSNFWLVLNVNYWPITVSLGLGALFDIVNRIVNKTYNTKSVWSFIKTEFRFPADLELVTLIILAIEAYEHNYYGNPLVWLVFVLILADCIRQKRSKKHLVKAK